MLSFSEICAAQDRKSFFIDLLTLISIIWGLKDSKMLFLDQANSIGKTLFSEVIMVNLKFCLLLETYIHGLQDRKWLLMTRLLSLQIFVNSKIPTCCYLTIITRFWKIGVWSVLIFIFSYAWCTRYKMVFIDSFPITTDIFLDTYIIWIFWFSRIF